MKPAAWIAVFSIALASPATAVASPADSAAAERFIDGLYARYQAEPRVALDQSAPWRMDSVYTPELIALFERVASFAGPDEVPEFADGDHICQCQDWENLRLLERRIRETGAGLAEADIRFENAGQTKNARILLARTPAGWRVADLHYDFYPEGLAAAIRASIARSEQERAAQPH